MSPFIFLAAMLTVQSAASQPKTDDLLRFCQLANRTATKHWHNWPKTERMLNAGSFRSFSAKAVLSSKVTAPPGARNPHDQVSQDAPAFGVFQDVSQHPDLADAYRLKRFVPERVEQDDKKKRLVITGKWRPFNKPAGGYRPIKPDDVPDGHEKLIKDSIEDIDIRVELPIEDDQARAAKFALCRDATELEFCGAVTDWTLRGYVAETTPAAARPQLGGIMIAATEIIPKQKR